MFSPGRVLWFIILISLLALLIDLPRLPIRFQYGSLKVDKEIGGFVLNLFEGKIHRNFEIRKGLDVSGGIRVTLLVDVSRLEKDRREEALAAVRSVLERRVNLFGVAEPNVQRVQQGQESRLIVEIPGVYDSARALSLIGQTAKLDFKEFVPEATLSARLGDPYRSSGVTGADLKLAQLEFDDSTGSPQVAFELTDSGAQKFKEVTRRLLAKPTPVERILAIFLDDVPLSTPEVKSVIEQRGVISGNFSLDEAKDLTTKLNAGALPVPIKVIAQENIGATLGARSVAKSVLAGLVGLALVCLFMVGNYGLLGFIAVAALIVYGLLTLAIYKIVPVVLTLPGLAGFLLSIGMAVDANILIFERIKEERRAGQALKGAIEKGFGRAWAGIRDANVATLMTSFVLFNPLNWSFLNSSGLVRGFALTLALGIFLSLFTGIVVTRTLVRLFYR